MLLGMKWAGLFFFDLLFVLKIFLVILLSSCFFTLLSVMLNA